MRKSVFNAFLKRGGEDVATIDPINSCDIKMRCFPWIAPFAFVECGLTVEEQIYYLVGKINDIIDTLNEGDEDIRSYVDQKVSAAISACNSYTDNKISEQWTNLIASVNAVKDYAESLNASLKMEVQQELSKVWNAIWKLTTYQDPIIVIDPTTGKQNSLQNTLNNLYETFRYFALTASRYDGLGLTASEYDEKHVTAFDYDHFGLLLFQDAWLSKYIDMFHPVTGQKVFYQEVVKWCIDQHRANALTASGYDAINIEASEYDGHALSAYEYDFNGKTQLES